MKYKTFKEVTDFILALMALIVLFWFLIFIALAIMLDSKGPILFKQKRIGKNKRLFVLYKFRSMKIYTPKNTPTHLLHNPDLYITRIGKYLRTTSIDEIPQIWNILIGDISLVGPRPALWNQYDLIAEREKYGANNLKPGLTGWAQVNGRDKLPIQQKAKFDGTYASNVGLKMDTICFFKTIINVFKKDGIVEGEVNSLKSASNISNRMNQC